MNVSGVASVQLLLDKLQVATGIIMALAAFVSIPYLACDYSSSTKNFKHVKHTMQGFFNR
jgi:hypothetical protein